jgi:hypothetical protein
LALEVAIENGLECIDELVGAAWTTSYGD